MNYRSKRKLMGYVFLLPSFFFLACFLLYPFCKSVVMSFTNWNGMKDTYKFVGLQNYIDLFNNKNYWAAIKINLKFAVISTAIQTFLGYLLAYAVYNMTRRWQAFYKVALYIPVILPASVIAVMWKFLLGAQTGLVNTVLRSIGLGNLAHGWVGEKATALGTIIFVNTWQYIGFTMVLFYIAMQNISTEVLESAEVDGANKWHKLIYFFVPMTVGTTETNVILSITGGMKSFALFYMRTGGGPGKTTKVVSMLIYETAFTEFKFNKALAMAAVLFVIILILTVISRYIGAKYNYENDDGRGRTKGGAR